MSALEADRCPDCGEGDMTYTYDAPAPGQRPEDAAYDASCSACSFAFYAPAEASARSRIGKLREIRRSGMAARVDGYLVDIQTASLLVQVYDALSRENRERFGKPTLPRLVDFAWSRVKTG